MPNVSWAKVSLNRARRWASTLPSSGETVPEAEADDFQAGMVEGAGKLDIDGGADRAGGQRGVWRLHHIHLADKVRADGAEIERPVLMPLDILRLLNRVSLKEGPKPRTVIWLAMPVEVGTPPRLERPRLTVTPGMRCMAAAISAIGEFADILGRDGVDQAGRVALDVQIGPQGMDQAGNGDALGLVILGLGRVRRRSAHVGGSPGRRRRIITAPRTVCSTNRSVPVRSWFRASTALNWPCRGRLT